MRSYGVEVLGKLLQRQDAALIVLNISTINAGAMLP
jgi:hypothetical protein